MSFIAIASQGEFDEFDLNEFFAATGTGETATFKHKNDVQKCVGHHPRFLQANSGRYLKLGSARPPFPYSDVRLLPYLHTRFGSCPTSLHVIAVATHCREITTSSGRTTRCSSLLAQDAGCWPSTLCPPRAGSIGHSGFDSTDDSRLSCGKTYHQASACLSGSSILMLP